MLSQHQTHHQHERIPAHLFSDRADVLVIVLLKPEILKERNLQ